MANLTDTAIVARKAIRYSIYALIILLTGRLLLGVAVGIFRYFFPEPPPAPTVLFSRLPNISFPDSKADSSKLTFTLQTPEGSLPAFPTQEKVYFMPKIQSNLFSVENGLDKGKALGFINNGQRITETLYRFKHQSLPKTLDINIVTNIFSISYDLAADPSAIEAIPPAPEIAQNQLRTYLSSAELLPTDLEGPVTHDFLKVEQGKLVPAISLSESDVIRINLFRSPYDKLPSMGPDPKKSNVWFLVSGSKEQDKKILAGEYHYLPIDKDKSSTYPIKTAGEAWNDLTNGKAYVAESSGETNIVIRRVYLAYYDPDKASDFFQPIIVFEGDNFTAYVPAVTDEYYGE